jgi:hemolysin activation/secretion protein
VYTFDDRIPWSGYIGYEDSGNESTNLERTIYGIHWGNAFGLDHSLGYQYTASPNYRDLEAHTAAYTIPLRNRDQLVVYGSYATVHPTIGPGFMSDGFAWQTSARYYHEIFPGPCCPHRCLERNIIFGFDFRRTNSSLIFGQNVVFDDIADIAQLMVGYQSVLQNECGDYCNWGTELYIGPHWGFSPHNNDRDFNALRPGASSDYVYARAYFERLRHLNSEFDTFWRIAGQVSESNLLASEQIGLGGYNTVRGYDMRLVNGDSGLVFNAELRTRPICMSYSSRCSHEMILLTFFDFGVAGNHDLFPAEEDSLELASVGWGLRYRVGQHVSARFDYGWQLIDDDIPANFKDSRPHVGVVATF